MTALQMTEETVKKIKEDEVEEKGRELLITIAFSLAKIADNIGLIADRIIKMERRSR